MDMGQVLDWDETVMESNRKLVDHSFQVRSVRSLTRFGIRIKILNKLPFDIKFFLVHFLLFTTHLEVIKNKNILEYIKHFL